MKLIIQIPCYNEEKTLPITLSCLPRKVYGFKKVEWLIIDDGSDDETVEMAKKYGVDYVIKHTRNKGLARAFMSGLDAALNLGADVILNIDADNQYDANYIPNLTSPIITNDAEMVIGARPIKNIEHFSFIKKFFQKLGSKVVKFVSKIDVSDAPSGFRAMSKTAASKIMLFNEFTYTLETIIQAGQKDIHTISVPVRVNKDLRPSRLFTNIFSYIRKSIVTIIRIFVIYRPFRFFFVIGSFFFIVGFLIAIRFLFFYMLHKGAGHVQSLILSGLLIGLGLHTILIGFIADLSAANRKLLEDIRFRLSNFIRNDYDNKEEYRCQIKEQKDYYHHI